MGTRQRDHGLGRKRLSLGQQTAEGVIHRRFAVAGGMLQNLQVGAAGHLGRVLIPQPVIGHPKAAVGEQVLAIAVVLEGPRLADQLVDDVPVVDRVLVAAHQSRQRVDVKARIPQLDTISVQPRFEFLADQPAVDRVRVAVNMDQAPRVHADRQPQATILPLFWKRPQHRHLLGMPHLAACIPRRDDAIEKPQVFLSAAEVAAATQEQRLVHRGLEVSVRRLAVAILVRLADVDPLARQAVVVQQPPIAGLKFAFGRQVVDRRAQAVAAMPPRHSPQFPECVLQTVGQRLERLRRADGHRLPVGVREHEVIRQMLEAFAEDGDSQGIHVGEIRGRQVAGVMHLAEHHRACLAERGAPLLDAPLERAALALGELAGILAL